MYDVIIIGGGPAGLTAGLYCARARLKVLLLEKLAPGGQVLTTDQVENYPGFPDGVSGFELVDRIKNGGVLPMFTSCCPGWVNFFEEYFPDLKDIPSTSKSPQQMFGALAGSAGQSVGVVGLGTGALAGSAGFSLEMAAGSGVQAVPWPVLLFGALLLALWSTCVDQGIVQRTAASRGRWRICRTRRPRPHGRTLWRRTSWRAPTDGGCTAACRSRRPCRARPPSRRP